MSFSRYFLITSCFVCVFVGTTTTTFARAATSTNQQATVNRNSQKSDSRRVAEAENVVTSIFDEGISAIQKETDQCTYAFKKILENYFDCDYIFEQAFKSHLQKLQNDDKMRKKAKASIMNLQMYQYLNTFLRYKDKEVKYKIFGSFRVKNTGFCRVNSQVQSGTSITKIQWILKRSDDSTNDWKVVDVSYKRPGDSGYTNVKTVLETGISGGVKQSGLKTFIDESVKEYGGINENGEQDLSRIKAKLNSVTH